MTTKTKDNIAEFLFFKTKDMKHLYRIHSRQAANNLTSKFEEMNILIEITRKKLYKKYTFIDFVRIIEKGTQI